MASWWRRFAESIGVPAGNKSWRVKAIQHLALTDEDLAPDSGGWDRRHVYYFNRMKGTGPWARHLLLGEPDGSQITNGVVHEGDPVFYEGVRVVHNG